MTAPEFIDFDAVREDALWMARHGETWQGAAARLGMSKHRLEGILKREGATRALLIRNTQAVAA
jgi:hypothetical protein